MDGCVLGRCEEIGDKNNATASGEGRSEELTLQLNESKAQSSEGQQLQADVISE